VGARLHQPPQRSACERRIPVQPKRLCARTGSEEEGDHMRPRLGERTVRRDAREESLKKGRRPSSVMGTADSTSRPRNSGSPASKVASSLSATLPTVYRTQLKNRNYLLIYLDLFYF